jgi:heme A synthase
LWLTIIVCLLGGIFSWAPVIPQAPTVLHQGLAAVVVAGSVLIIVLVLLPTSRRAYT